MTDDQTGAPPAGGAPPQDAQPAGDAGAQQTSTIAPFKGAEDVPSKQTFLQRIDDAIANLADVSVSTLVTDVIVGVDERGRLKTVTSPTIAVPAIITNVNLIDGNVTTILGPSLKDDSTLTTFHQGLVTQAVKVLPDNLKALAQLVEGVFGKLTGK